MTRKLGDFNTDNASSNDSALQYIAESQLILESPSIPSAAPFAALGIF